MKAMKWGVWLFHVDDWTDKDDEVNIH